MFFLSMYGNLFHAQCSLLCNTDFENNQVTSSVGIIDTSLVPCWGTTAPDNMIEVWHTGFNGVPSYSGNQFIELNAFFVSTLFQNFNTTPGTLVTISFAHRGRAGTDVMGVSVGPVGGALTSLGTFTDGNAAWGYYTVNYVIPAGFGNNYTLQFNSISAAGGNPALGNFLDAISVALPSSATLSLTSTPASCGSNNGSAQVASVTGGASPFSYTWSPGGGNSANITGIATGIYSVNVSETNGCIATGTVLVGSGASLTLTPSSVNASCNGAMDGSAQVAISGGIMPYSYTWSPTGGNLVSASGLGAGIYTVYATSSNGCAGSATINVNQSTTLSAVTAAQSESCFGAHDGIAQVTASGGGIYTYTWSPGGANSSSIASLAPGTYTVNVSSSGCATTKTVSVNQGNPINFSFATVNPSCVGVSDGSAQATITGGTGGYTYTWSPIGGNAASASGLSSGTYSLMAISGNGCSGSSTVTVNPGLALNLIASSQAASCLGANDGTAQLVVNGGVAPYSYTWTPSGLNTQSISALSPGNYTVQTLSSNGCAGTQTVLVAPGLPISLNVISQNITCFGLSDGTAQVTANAGTAPYTYGWSLTGSSTSGVTGLAAGMYSVQVTSSDGCTGSKTFSITQPSSLNLTTTSQSVSCSGSANGSVQVFATGGTIPYTYAWAPSGQNTQSISGLSPGTYSCTVTDFNSCHKIVSMTISGVPSPTVTVSTSTVCQGNSTTLQAFGASAYIWLPDNKSGSTFYCKPLTTTTYSLVGFNQYGCADTVLSQVIVNPLPTVMAGNDTVINIDELITLTGTSSGYYGWIPFGNNMPLSCNYCHETTENPQTNTCYVLEAVNEFNCYNSDTICVSITDDWNIYIPNTFTPNRNEMNDIFIPVGYGITDIELEIYDRWGAKIFKSDDKTKGWDGTYKNKVCQTDVYVYKVIIITMTGHEEQRVGHVTLLK